MEYQIGGKTPRKEKSGNSHALDPGGMRGKLDDNDASFPSLSLSIGRLCERNLSHRSSGNIFPPGVPPRAYEWLKAFEWCELDSSDPLLHVMRGEYRACVPPFSTHTPC